MGVESVDIFFLEKVANRGFSKILQIPSLTR